MEFPRHAQALRRNPLTRALLWASKTNPHLVALCSGWAIATQIAFGVFVVFSALSAFGSMYYTLSTLNAPSSLVRWIALVWSIFILFLEREIAGGLDRTTAMIRPFLALFIGTLVAVPLELWVFENRIDQELQRQYRSENQVQIAKLSALEAELDQRHAAMEATLADLRKQEADWGKILDSEAVGRPGPGRTGIPGAGPVFRNAQAQQADVQRRIEEVRRDLEQYDRSLPEERQRLEAQFHREEVGKITDFVTRYEGLDKVVHSSNALFRLSWLITLALIFIDMTVALLKLLTPHSDYHHLVSAEIRENVTRIDEISERNYRLAMQDPEVPRASVAEKFAKVRYSPVTNHTTFERDYETKAQA